MDNTLAGFRVLFGASGSTLDYKVNAWPVAILGKDPTGLPIPLNADANGNLIVAATITPSGTQDVNVTKFGGTAFSLGQQLAAVSLPVVLTAAQITSLTAPVLAAGTNAIGSVRVTPATASTLANVSSANTNTTLQASNASRRGLLIFNDSTAILYVKFGATATTISYTVQLAAGAYYEFPSPIYTGIVDGIWASANGSARMTEIT